MPMAPLSFEGEHFFSIKMLVACKWWVSEDTEREKEMKEVHNSISNSYLKDSLNSRFYLLRNYVEKD